MTHSHPLLPCRGLRTWTARQSWLPTQLRVQDLSTSKEDGGSCFGAVLEKGLGDGMSSHTFPSSSLLEKWWGLQDC